eukprot:625983-Rhodomonas_salina.1
MAKFMMFKMCSFSSPSHAGTSRVSTAGHVAANAKHGSTTVSTRQDFSFGTCEPRSPSYDRTSA